MGKECEIACVDDIGETAEVEEGDLEEKGIVRKVVEEEIDAVTYCEEYDRCIGRGTNVESVDELLCECTKVWPMKKKCKKSVSARVMVIDRAGKVHSLMMFDSVVKTIVGEGASN